jgi:hypothetical protein
MLTWELGNGVRPCVWASHLIKYDSILGTFAADVKVVDDTHMSVDGRAAPDRTHCLLAHIAQLCPPLCANSQGGSGQAREEEATNVKRYAGTVSKQ